MLASNQATQAHLRKYLRSAFPDSSSSSQPNVSDILNANIPYLDAVLEEVLRLSNTVPLLVRVATVDTTVLGHQISAGTHIGMNAQFSTQYDVSEALRSQSCQAAWVKAGARTFVDSDLSSFWPERWIDDQGKFNPKALTKLAFSLGQRGCFGK